MDAPRPTWGPQYQRLARRIGANRAAMAVTPSPSLHKVISLCIHYFEERDRTAIARRSVRQLERLGYKITLEAPTLQTA